MATIDDIYKLEFTKIQYLRYINYKTCSELMYISFINQFKYNYNEYNKLKYSQERDYFKEYIYKVE